MVALRTVKLLMLLELLALGCGDDQGSEAMPSAVSGGGGGGDDSGGNGLDGGGFGSGSGFNASVPGVASVQFAPGSLPDGTIVKVESSTDADSLSAFDESGVIYQPVARADGLVRITTGSTFPSDEGGAILDVPPSLAIGSGQTVVALARIPTGNDEEYYDDFEPVTSLYDGASNKVTVLLPSLAFTANRTGDGTFEAILLLVVVARPARPVASTLRLKSVATDIAPGSGCAPGGRFRPPLDRQLYKTSGLSSVRALPINGAPVNGHPGIDLRARSGTLVVAPRGGTVIKSVKTKTCGEMIVIGTDLGTVRFCHLTERRVSEGAVVVQGEPVGTSGNTGTYTKGPHLHMEWLQDVLKLDAWPCILPHDYEGTASVRIEAVGTGTVRIVNSADANARFSYNDADDAWNVTGDVTGSYVLDDYINSCQISMSGSGPVSSSGGGLGLRLGDRYITKYSGGDAWLGELRGTTDCNSEHIPEPIGGPTPLIWFDTGLEEQTTASEGGELSGSYHKVETLPMGSGSTTEDANWSLSWRLHAIGQP